MKKCILIIEDNEKNLQLERDLLEAAGFEVLEAKNGTRGIEKAKNEKPDAIVMDLRLPDLGGMAVARTLRESSETCSIPIIFATASVMGEGREELLSIPRSCLITKPLDTRTFASEVEHFMKGPTHG